MGARNLALRKPVFDTAPQRIIRVRRTIVKCTMNGSSKKTVIEYDDENLPPRLVEKPNGKRGQPSGSLTQG